MHYKNRKGENDLGPSIFKLRLSFDVLVSRNKVLLESSHYIETHLDVVAGDL